MKNGVPRWAAGLVGWAVALALVLQAALAGPLALRMAEQPSAAGILAFSPSDICSSHAPGDPSPDRHRHDECLLCQAAFAPLLLVAASFLVLVPGLRSETPGDPVSAHVRVFPAAYHSRAPPTGG